VAYVADIVLIAKTEDELNSTNILLKEGKEISLNINEAKTKYMIISRQNN